MPTKCTKPVLIALAVGLNFGSLTLPASAQVDGSDMMSQSEPDRDRPEIEPTLDSFADADRDGDQTLDLPEFRTWILHRAEDGDEAAKTILLSGDYKSAFADRDQDMDGVLSRAEVRDTQIPSSQADDEPNEDETPL